MESGAKNLDEMSCFLSEYLSYFRVSKNLYKWYIKQKNQNLKPQKILVVTSWFPSKSQPYLGSFVWDHVCALKKNGIEVEVLKVYISGTFISKFGWNKQNEVLINEGVKVHSVSLKPFLPGFRTWTLSKLSQFAADSMNNGFDFDVIHSHAVFEGGWVAKSLAKRFNIPWVHTEHASQFIYGMDKLSLADKARAFSVMDGANSLVFVSEFQRKKVIQNLGLSSDKSKVIPNLLPSEFLVKNQVETKPYTAITIQSWVEVKQPQFLLEAWKNAFEIQPEIRLLWIGAGPLKVELMSKFKDEPFLNGIQFIDYASRSEVVNYLNQSSFYVSSSASETFGLSILEALSQGLPVLAVDNGSVGDLVKSGFGKITPNDVSLFQEALQEMVLNSTEYSIDRQVIHDRFSETAIVKVWAEEYTNLGI